MGLSNPNPIDVITDAVMGGALISWEEETEEESNGFIDIVKNSIFGTTNTIDPDVKKSETHQLQSEVTQNVLETGELVTEHIIQKPIKVSLVFEMTNGTIGGTLNPQIGSMLGFNTVFDKLYKIWEQKIECTITTFHKSYENMVIENMPIVHKAPYKGAYKVACDFIKLTKKNIGLTPAKEEETAMAATETQEGGLQKTEPAEGLTPDAPKEVNGQVIEKNKYYKASSREEAWQIQEAGGISW